MIIKKLNLKNIRSYEDLEISFPKGSVLLSGDIGSGKTSILLGLGFALFGLQPGQKGASILRQGTENAYASLEFEIDGEDFILERTIKKSKNGSITQDSNILIAGSAREEISSSEMKERVLKILNYPREFAKKSNLLYKYTVYTPQEEMKSIIQERPEIRLDTLRHIFGIDRYKRIKENSQIFLQRLKDNLKIKEVLVSELNILREKLNIESEKKIFLARELNNLKIEYGRIILEKENSEKKLLGYDKIFEDKKELDMKKSKIEALIQGKKDLEIRIKKEIFLMGKQLEEEIDFSSERLVSVGELLTKHRNVLEKSNVSLTKLISQISVLNSRKEEQMKLKEKIYSMENCPTCFQVVGGEHKEKISKRTLFGIEEINRELESKLIEKENLNKEIKSEKELILGYENDFGVLQQNKIKFEHRKEIETKIKSESFVLERTTNEIKILEEELAALNVKLFSFKNSAGEYEKARSEFKRIFEITRAKEILVATKEKELEILKIKISELESEIKTKEKIQDEANYLRSLKRWLEDKFLSLIILAEKNVLAKLRSEFSSIFAEWFSMLAPSALSVRLDEEFTPIITNQDYEIDYEFLSGGERTAVALAYRLALNQVLNSILSRIKTKDLVILDEPTEGFSETQIDKMRDIFEQLKTEQTILVSHEQKIEGFVDHVIKVRKEGISKIEGGL